MDGFLLLAFLFLIAGVIAVPIASRLGLGSVLGYLLAGIAISPLLRELHVDVVSKSKKRKLKKDAQLVLRLDSELRDRFVDTCRELDTTAAREVRRFIRRFLRRYENGELDE